MIRFSDIKAEINNNKILKELSDVVIFMLITVTLHILWWNVIWPHKEMLYVDHLAEFLTVWLYKLSSMALNVIQFPHKAFDNCLYFDYGYIDIIQSCSGLKQFYQIFFLLLFFPGKWKPKLWFIPLGMIVLYIVNVLRIIILSYVLKYFPEYWHFSHDWILRPFFYVVIFYLWMYYLKKLSGRYEDHSAAA